MSASKLLLALPLYTHVSTQWLLRFLQLDKAGIVDMVAVRKMYLAAAMNEMITSALQSGIDWDRFVVLEADVIPPKDALTRITQYPDHLDIVGSMYFQHIKPHRCHAFTHTGENEYMAWDQSQVDAAMAAPGLYPCDAVGFGLTSVHRRVLENWSGGPMFGGETELGHDLYFCRAAKAQGRNVHVDSGIHCSHLTEVAINYDNTKD